MAIQDELKDALISAQTVEPGVVSIEFQYPPAFTGFQGHFPGDPILPGVCLLQSLRIGLEQAWQMPLRLAEVVNAKFIMPARPGEKLLYTVRESARADGVISTKTKVTCNGERVAEFSVKLEEISVS